MKNTFNINLDFPIFLLTIFILCSFNGCAQQYELSVVYYDEIYGNIVPNSCVDTSVNNYHAVYFEGKNKKLVKIIGFGSNSVIKVYKIKNESDSKILSQGYVDFSKPWSSLVVSQVEIGSAYKVETANVYRDEKTLVRTLIYVTDSNDLLLAYKAVNATSGKVQVFQKMKYDDMGVLRLKYDVLSGNHYYYPMYNTIIPEKLSLNQLSSVIKLEEYYSNSKMQPIMSIPRLPVTQDGIILDTLCKDSIKFVTTLVDQDTVVSVYRKNVLVSRTVGDSILDKFSYNEDGDLKLVATHLIGTDIYFIRRYSMLLPPDDYWFESEYMSERDFISFFEKRMCQYPDCKFLMNNK